MWGRVFFLFNQLQRLTSNPRQFSHTLHLHYPNPLLPLQKKPFLRAKTKAALQSNMIFTAHLDGSHRNRTWLWCIHLHLPKNYRTSTAHSLQINLSICKEGYFFSDMSGHLPATAVATTLHLFDETWGQFPAVSVQLNGIFLMRRQNSFLPFNLKRCVFRSLTKHFGA